MAVFLSLFNILPKTVRTIDEVWCFLRVDRYHLLFTLVARAFVELAFAAQCHALAMAAIGAVVGERKFFLFVERRFLCDDNKIFPALGVSADEFDGVADGTHSPAGEEIGGMA